MKSKSPFTKDRFENEREHLYYLQDRTIDNLEQEKPIFLLGSRGTGKTTLLNALSWRERLNNSSLKQILNNKLFDTNFIGNRFSMKLKWRNIQK